MTSSQHSPGRVNPSSMLPFSDKGVTNKFLEDFLVRICDPSYFGGVYASDEFNIKLLNGQKRKGWIVNLNPKKKKDGGHFVCILQEKNVIFYIDPVGLPCLSKPLRAMLVKSGKKILFNSSQIQHFQSVACGMFSVLFLLYFSKKKRGFKMKFDTVDKKRNDSLCFKYLQKIVNSDEVKLIHVLQNVM